ncbi:MAG: hypothetical protein ACYDCJ_04885 [Gammaproteobacteria bacterium]
MELAFSAKADMLITGDKDLLMFADKFKFLVCNPAVCRDRIIPAGKF